MHYASASMTQPRSGPIRNTRGGGSSGGRGKRKTSGGVRRSTRLVKSEAGSAGSAGAEGQDEDAEGEDDNMDDDDER